MRNKLKFDFNFNFIIMTNKILSQNKLREYLPLALVGIISPLLFLTLYIVFGFVIEIILLPFNTEISTTWFSLLFCLFLLPASFFVCIKLKNPMLTKCLFGIIPITIFMFFSYLGSSFTEISGWSGYRVFSINPFGLSTTNNLNIPTLFVPMTMEYIASVVVVMIVIFLSLFIAAKKFNLIYLLTSVSSLFSIVGIILFFDFIDQSSGPGIVGSYVPFLISSVLIFVYFSFKKFPKNFLIRFFAVFTLLLSLGIVQDYGCGHLILLWTPIDFNSWFLMGGGYHVSLVIFWGLFERVLSSAFDCFKAHTLSWISAVIYWMLLSRLIIFIYDKKLAKSK